MKVSFTSMLSMLALRGQHTAHAFNKPCEILRRATALSAKGKSRDLKKEKNVYASTISLPETPFSQRANAITKEPEIQKWWHEKDLYHKLSNDAKQAGAERFVLHDGPPYANGDLHCGHALNKILKDFVNRNMVLSGKQVHYIPGWDCHGLPIELKVLQTMKAKEREGLTPVTLREKAANFAKEAAEKQSASFQRYGIFGDFEKPYLTLQPSFEAAQIELFGEMFKKGYIFRGRKPVHWSPSSQTALAEAELEYPEGHISKSIYVAFKVTEPSKSLTEFHSDEDPLRVAIWTTTPWTIPANMAVAINPALNYAVVTHSTTGKLIVAADLVQSLEKVFNLPIKEKLEILETVKGDALIGTKYSHPLNGRKLAVVAGGDYITTESGTGLVHTAPGHGQEDYKTGLKNGLELVSPVDDVGKFTLEAGEEFVGLSVLGEGNQAIIDALSNNGALLKAEDYGHKYPYDWRTKKPTIFRATDQWFASVEGFRDGALDAIESVRWVPDVGKKRIKSFVTGRGDWCISRQRSWGVPIPVFYDKETGKEFLLNEETLAHIKALFQEHGSDAWWKREEKYLLPEKYRDEADKWKKGTDTMDVWFDSGSSWAGVTKEREELAYPADLYLEGSDQHRGWFQSSLLTSVAVNDQAPYKTVLTHGFVLDEKGFKMSKSLGNVVNPVEVIEGGKDKKIQPAYGADVLRLWVASVDYSGDVSIGPNIIKQACDNYRKLRNTARFLIGNLADFVPNGQARSNAVAYSALPSLDKWMLGRLSALLKEVSTALDEYQFQRAVQETLRFASSDLSNFYLDIAKDRIYVSAINDARRRCCQTVIQACVEGFAKAVAPILPHLAEEMWQHLPYEKENESVFEGGWPQRLLEYPEHDTERWDLVRKLRDDVNKLLELARSDKLVGASLDAAAIVYAEDEKIYSILKSLAGDESMLSSPVKTNGVDELRTVLMLSQVKLVSSKGELEAACNEKYMSVGTTSSGCIIGVVKAAGRKCSRCWFYDSQIGKLGLLHADVCQRCNHAIEVWEKETGHTFVQPDAEVKEPVC